MDSEPTDRSYHTELQFAVFLAFCLPSHILIDWLIDDSLYSAIPHSLEQAHCTHIWFYMSD